jgi:DNA polymerase-3 subunit delta'
MPCFSDIVGQPRAVEALQRSIASNRLAHAYLFSGPDGVGKRTTARALAAALNCATRPGEGCDVCGSCLKLAHNHHPDLIVLLPDGAFIKIEQVRALQPHLAAAPHEGRYRLVLIDGAEALHPSAANALLKAVEEPRSDTLFVLCTAAPQRVIPTLVSRSRQIRFVPLARKELLGAVQASGLAEDVDEETLRWACAVSEGSPGRACMLVSDELAAAARDLAQSLDEAATQSAATPIFRAAEAARRAERPVLRQALELTQLRLRDRLLTSVGLGDQRRVFSPGDAGDRPDAQPISCKQLLRQLEAVQTAQRALEGNANAVLTLESLAFDLQEETNR